MEPSQSNCEQNKYNNGDITPPPNSSQLWFGKHLSILKFTNKTASSWVADACHDPNLMLRRCWRASTVRPCLPPPKKSRTKKSFLRCGDDINPG